jgi:hypothetical protein
MGHHMLSSRSQSRGSIQPTLTRIEQQLAVAVCLAVLGLAGCGRSTAQDSQGSQVNQTHAPLQLTGVANQGSLDFGGEVPTTSPAAFIAQPSFGAHGYTFNGVQGAVVTIETGSHDCLIDTKLTLFGPQSAPNVREELAEDHGSVTGTQPLPGAPPDYSCSTISRIDSFPLPVSGQYLAVVTASNPAVGQTYGIRLTCGTGSCEAANQLDFPGTQGAMSIGAPTLTPAFGTNAVIGGRSIFAVGGFLFEHNYAAAEGLGNAILGIPGGPNPRPNMRKVHYHAFGGPEATSCVSCHNESGDTGAGSNFSNIFQIGDGSNPATGLERNPPHLLGMGYREEIGAEMTNDLQEELQNGIVVAQETGAPVQVPLSSKGVSFGSLVANPNGTTDLSQVQGVDTDLVVRPFGWKGREATLRRFIEGGLRVHFGMQTTPSVQGHCVTPNTDTFGTGSDCLDPDGDGVYDEINDAQLTALSVWAALLQAPTRVPPSDPNELSRTQAGELLFNQVGCAGCHQQNVLMNTSQFQEPSDTGLNPVASIDLTQGVGHRLVPASDGTTQVEVWSDFKRHDMGPALADSKAFKQIGARFFITTPLWGVADTAPFLHDGRAATLSDAILQHGGEGAAAAAAYAALTPDEQGELVEFLGTLSRAQH